MDAILMRNVNQAFDKLLICALEFEPRPTFEWIVQFGWSGEP